MMETVDRETGEIIAMPGTAGAVAAPEMPPAIAAAIVAVKTKVRQLGSDERNKHGDYAYVSVDKFYAELGPLMATEGLALLIDETESEVKTGTRDNPWLFVQYELRFMHSSGAMSPPMRRSCALPISGPQAYGAAQSYIEKQFLRQVFKIPTGEKDADSVAPGEDAPAGRSRGRAAPNRAQPMSDGGEARKLATERYKGLLGMIRSAETIAGLPNESWPEWRETRRLIATDYRERGTPDYAAEADKIMAGLLREVEAKRRVLIGESGA